MFGNDGVNCPIDEIAKEAGLGVGTLYRHFPTKEALIAAIVVMNMEESIADIRAAIASGEDAGEKFFSSLARMIDGWQKKKSFMEVLSKPGVDLTDLARTKVVFHRELGRLLDRAQAEGAVRPHVSEQEILAVVHGTIVSLDRAEISAAGRERILAILYDGLRPPVIPARAAKRRARAS